MLLIAASIANEAVRERSESALPTARVTDSPAVGSAFSQPRARRALVATLRRIASLSAGLAERVEGPVPST